MEIHLKMLLGEPTARRRQRREYARSRPIDPADILIANMLNTDTNTNVASASATSSAPSPAPMTLAQHMENARREYTTRRTSSGSSPRHLAAATVANDSNRLQPSERTPTSDGDYVTASGNSNSTSICNSPAMPAVIRPDAEQRRKHQRLADVAREMDELKERTRSKFAEIAQITANCQRLTAKHTPAAGPETAPSSNLPVGEPADTVHAPPPVTAAPNASVTFSSYDDFQRPTNGHRFGTADDNPLGSSPAAAAAENDDEPQSSAGSRRSAVNMRRKSSEESNPPNNNIVSILKKKDHHHSQYHANESSSPSCNASPVTFSSSVVDTPTRSGSAGRQGILKKRSSLDESRWSRSHSPDERSILVRTPRRNSLEEIQQHIGILKQQRSFEQRLDEDGFSGSGIAGGSTSGGGSSSVGAATVGGTAAGANAAAEPHSILKKRSSHQNTLSGGSSSNLGPMPSSSEGGYTKHVSISEAVILAAAELYKDGAGALHCGTSTAGSQSDGGEDFVEIRPILKPDTQNVSTPRPILKKKYSDAAEEIRPILKGSRKSSRDETLLLLLTTAPAAAAASDNGGESRRRTVHESPAKRRSLIIDPFDTNVVLERSRSYEVEAAGADGTTDGTDGPATGRRASNALASQVVIEKPLISVAERVKHMEQVFRTSTAGGDGIATHDADAVVDGGAVGMSASNRRHRFKTQPVTVAEIHW